MSDIGFTLVVCMSFVLSLSDHYWVGTHEKVNKPLRAALLGSFIITETWVALDGKPAMFLYVLLNVIGLYFLYLHRKVPLAGAWLKRRRKWFRQN